MTGTGRDELPPLAVFRGSVTAHDVVIGSRRSAFAGELGVHSDHLELKGTGLLRFLFRPTRVPRTSIQVISPLIITTPVIHWHPGAAGWSMIEISPLKWSRYEKGSIYFFVFASPSLDEVLRILTETGYPVTRVPRYRGFLNGIS